MKWNFGRGPIRMKNEEKGIRVGLHLGPLQVDISAQELKDHAVDAKNKVMDKATAFKNRLLRKKPIAELDGTVEGVIENEE